MSAEMSGYFIAPDAHDEPTLWRGSPDDDYPIAVTTRREVGDMRVWEALEALAVAAAYLNEPPP